MCFIPRRLYIFIFIAFYESRFSLANESPPAKTAPAAIDNSKQFHNGDLSHHLERTARQFQSSQNTVYNPASGSNWNQPENNYYNQWNTPYSNSGQNNVNQWSDTNEGSGSAPSSHSTYPDQWGYEDQWDIEQNSGDGPIEIGSGEHPDTEKAWETPAIVPVDNGDIKFDNDYMELSPTTTTTGYDQPDIDIIKHVPLEPKVLPIPPEEEVRTTSATTQAPEIITDSEGKSNQTKMIYQLDLMRQNPC